MNIPPASLPRLLPVWAGLLLAAFSGILMACAFIPVDWSGCVWIGFLPLLTALWYGRRREGKRGILAYALYGWVFGVVFYGISFWWVNEVSTLGYIPLMIFYGGLFPGLWALVMGVFFRPDARPLPDARLTAKERRAAWKTWALGDILPSVSAALAGAALWVCLEWGAGLADTGLRLEQSGRGPLRQSSGPVGGIPWSNGAGFYSGRFFRLALARLPPGRNHDYP